MGKIARKIFQPNYLTNTLIEGACASGNIGMSDLVNHTIINYFTPKNQMLRKEIEYIFERISNHEDISQQELKAILARCVEALKDCPISDVKPLEQIFLHFTNPLRTVFRYDYILKVTPHQDKILHHLNDILRTIDKDFILGTREFGERSLYIFKHWSVLCGYSEIYTALATIIDCENIYKDITVFRAIDLINWLDAAARNSNLTALHSNFPTNITLEDRYYGIRYEITIYYTDNAYCALSGDIEFENMSPEIKAHYEKYEQLRIPYFEITEDDLQKLVEFERNARILFSRISLKYSR